MTAALRYEWVRVSTVRSTRISLMLALLVATGLAFLIASPVTSFSESGEPLGDAPELVQWYPAFGIPLTLTAVFAAIIASQSIGQEYRFGLIRLTLTAFPQRTQVLVAKLVWVVLAGVAVALASYAGSWVGVALRGHPVPPDGVATVDGTYLVRGAVYVVMFALSAFAIAGITRQTALGIAVPIISGLIVETILTAFLRDRVDWLVKILPWSAASRWGDESFAEFDAEQYYAVGWAALGLFGVWLLAFLAVQAALFLRRDA
jgi:ABC-type transport system involved in multi-copper enzyme maturation permease subunit